MGPLVTRERYGVSRTFDADERLASLAASPLPFSVVQCAYGVASTAG